MLGQVFLGTLVPLGLLGSALIYRQRRNRAVPPRIYFVSSLLILIGVFAMRWNVVIGGQLFSKSLRGFTTYKLAFVGPESLFTAGVLLALPLGILWVMLVLFPARHSADATPVGN